MVYDINLMPTARRGETSRIGFRMVLLGIAVAAVLVVCFGIYPMQTKIRLLNKLQEQEQELLTYASVETDYIEASAEVSELTGTVQLLKDLHDNKKDINPILDQVEASMPKLVVIKTITIENGLVTIDGSSSNYKEIAQFIVNLRKVEDFKDVIFTSALVQEDSSLEDNKKETRYDFTVFTKYEFMDIIGEQAAAMITEGEAAN